MVDQPTVAPEHAVACVVATDIDGFVTLRQDVEIAFPLLHAPAVRLTFAGQRRNQADVLLGALFLAGKNDLRTPDVCTQRHAGEKSRYAVLNERHDLKRHQCLEFAAVRVFFIVAEFVAGRSVSGKCTSQIFHNTAFVNKQNMMCAKSL